MKSVRIENIFKSYIKGENAVKNASFVAEPGEFVILVGPSGCGKTTILKMLAGLEDISSGNLYFDDVLMNDTEPKERNIGMVFQNYALYPHLTVFDNIAFPLSIKKEKKEIIKSKVLETAKILGLEEFLDKKPKQLSGGQRQRVALGRAIIRKPDVFLFDEPLSNLDAKLRVQMRTEIVNLHRISGATSIYVTHDQTEAMTMGTKLIVMNKGEIRQIGSPKEVYNQPVDLFTASFLGSPQINTFDGEIVQKDGIFFVENNTNNEFKLTEDLFKGSKVHLGKATIAIRPEYLVPTKSHYTINSINTKIFNIEFLGHEQILYFQNNGIQACRLSNITNQYTVGQNISFELDSANILIFDDAGLRV